ncbi:MAG: Phage tail protein E [bacterium ADurb.Bin212]|nr:MAG: Phage tail protein E [bacterium ADurb.Bin212]
MERQVVETMKLAYPIKEGERVVEFLEFVRPKVKHLQGIDLSKLSDTNNILKLTQALTSVDVKALKEMDLKDLKNLATVIQGFLEDSPELQENGMS